MLKVLGRLTSINVRKVLWAADEIGLVYEREDWGLPLRDPKAPQFLTLNPNALVPVIIDDGFVLWESNAILRYLAEKASSALLPADLRERAIMEQWLGWQVAELSPSWSYAFLALGRPTPGYDDRQKIMASIEKWSARMAILEQRLATTGAYVGGMRFTLADIAIGLSVHRWFRTPFDRPGLPEIARYYQMLRTRAAASGYLGDQTP